MTACTVEHRSRHGVGTVLLRRGDLTEAFITVHVDGKARIEYLLEEARDEVAELGLTVLRQDVFGTPAQHDAAPEMLRRICGRVDWPVTWLEEGDSLGERLTGTHVHAVAGAPVRRLAPDGAPIGSVYSDGAAEYCHLAGIVSANPRGSRAQQTRDVLEHVEAALHAAGMAFSHVVRTWFYNDRILEWYDEFNTVRTGFFDERKVFDGLVPASTGVGGGNCHEAALVADALAIRPLVAGPGGIEVQAVASPLQCPATTYRSSFSRAVEVTAPDHRRLYVSGTASIDVQGRTARVGDMAGQVDLTLDVVEAILHSRGMDWGDTSRAIAYVKHGRDAEAYREGVRRRGMSAIPAVVTENDICRDDLLFELEVDAIVAR